MISADNIIIVRFKAQVILRFLYTIHIYMLKISCRLSRFLAEWSFCAKVFSRRVPKMFCRIIHTVRDFSNKNYFVFIVNANNRTSSTMPFGYSKLKTTSRNPVRSSRNRWKIEAKFSCEAEGKITVRKTN